MSTDLEQQLARFAEALDRDAPTVFFDDIVGRGAVTVDVDLLEREVSDRAADGNAVSAIDAAPDHGEADAGDEVIELVPELVVRQAAWRLGALKVALAVAAVVLLVVSLAAIERGGDVDPADGFPKLTTTFVSPRNGFSIQHPDGAAITATTNDGEDGFDVIDTGLAAIFEATAEEFGDDLLVDQTPPPDERIDSYFTDAGVYPGGCGVPRREQEEITIDGQPGRIAESPTRIEATVVAGGNLYVFILSHQRSDARAVFDALVATIDLTPETAVHFPAMTTPFVSPTNGFSFRYIDRGGLEPATEVWDPVNQQPDADFYDRTDYFDTGFGAGFAGASTEVPEGVSIDAWVDEQVAPTVAGGCGVPRRQQEAITIDGQPGRIADCAARDGATARIEATVVADGRLYLFIMLHNARDDARAWFDTWLTTIELTPETTEGSP